MSNVKTVQKIYAAFGAGDIPSILAKLDDNVDWEYAASTDVPWLQHRSGRDAVANNKDTWGHLPPEIRAEIDNMFNELELPAKRRLIDRYYLSVARKSAANRDK